MLPNNNKGMYQWIRYDNDKWRLHLGTREDSSSTRVKELQILCVAAFLTEDINTTPFNDVNVMSRHQQHLSLQVCLQH